MSPSAVSAFLDSLRAMLSELEALPIPTIAIVDGVALGGGAELALGCDLRVGGPSALVGLPEVKLGIIPGAGGTQRMARLIGGGKAKELIYTGRRIEGVEAERIGESAVLFDCLQGGPRLLRCHGSSLDRGEEGGGGAERRPARMR